MENNLVSGQGLCPVVIGDHTGNYEIINNTIAYNMQTTEYGARDYAFVASYPDDETGISAEIALSLVNNIFAFNSCDLIGGPTGIYLGEGVTLVSEGHNLYWSYEDGEIQAQFVAGETWFSRENIDSGAWAIATGQGEGDLTDNPLFNAGLPDLDFHLQDGSPAIDAGTSTGAPSEDIESSPRPQGAGYDIGAYER